MSKTKMLAIDLGSSGGKAFIGVLDSKKLKLTEIHRFKNEAVSINGNLYWDFLRLFYEIKISMQKCYKLGHRDISTIGIDTWGVDFGLIDEYGNLIDNPRHYRDILKKDSIKEISRIINLDELYYSTGTSVRWTNTLMQWYSLYKNRNLQVKNAKSLLLLPDLFNFFLSGVKKTDLTIASTTQILNIHELEWDKKILSKLNLRDDILSDLIHPGTVIGSLSDEVMQDFGVKAHEVVAVAGHDTECAVAAIPATKDDSIIISCGTWVLVGAQIKRPVLSKKSRLLDFTNEQCLDGKIFYHKIINGLWLAQECKKEWENNGSTVDFDMLEKKSDIVKPLRCFINPNVQLLEENRGIIQKIKEYCSNTNQYVPRTMEETYVCILQSLAFEIKKTIIELEKILGNKYRQINIVGGGAKSQILCQFIANATGKVVIAGPYEATAIGNLLIQAMAIGVVEDVNKLRQIVIRSFKCKKFIPHNNSIWSDIYGEYKNLK